MYSGFTKIMEEKEVQHPWGWVDLWNSNDCQGRIVNLKLLIWLIFPMSMSSSKNESSRNLRNKDETSQLSIQRILSYVKRNLSKDMWNIQFTNLIQGIWVLHWSRSSSTLTNLHPHDYRVARHPVVDRIVQRIHDRWR